MEDSRQRNVPSWTDQDGFQDNLTGNSHQEEGISSAPTQIPL